MGDHLLRKFQSTSPLPHFYRSYRIIRGLIDEASRPLTLQFLQWREIDIAVDLPEYVNLVYINDEEKVRQGLRDQNALVEAAASNDMKGVSSALALGVDINGQDDNGQTALFSAAAYGHKSLAMFLLNEGAHINTHVGPKNYLLF